MAKFESLFESILQGLHEARTVGSGSSSVKLMVMFDVNKLGIEPEAIETEMQTVVTNMLADVKESYFEHMEKTRKVWDSNSKFSNKDSVFNKLVKIEKGYISNPAGEEANAEGQQYIVELKLNSGVTDDKMSAEHPESGGRTYKWSVAPIYDLIVGSKFTSVFDPNENELIKKHKELATKYFFVAEEMN